MIRSSGPNAGESDDGTASGRRLCIDEFGPLNLQPRHGRHYARTGHVDRRRATYSRTEGVRHMYAAYGMESDRLIGSFVTRKDWTTFLPFLETLRRRYRSGETLHLVPDHAGYHLKAEVQQYAATHNIRFDWTSTHVLKPSDRIGGYLAGLGAAVVLPLKSTI